MAHPTSSTETAPILCKSESLPTPKPALVNISQVNGHLVLLHAFAELKNQVEKLHQSVSHMPAQPDKRWAWFVAMSVERSVFSPPYFCLDDVSFSTTADLTFGVIN